MKKLAKASYNKTKNFVKTHKFAVSMTAVAIGAVALQQRNNKAFYQFLEEKGIDPQEYYCPEAYAEKIG